MPSWKKKLAAMRNQPLGWTYDDAATVLKNCGFRPPTKPKGSHRWWRHEATGQRVGLVCAGHGTLAPEYIKNMITTIDSLDQ
jgi:predicted RNA binding protein YcfA (HicA-like mRNA interferase family)